MVIPSIPGCAASNDAEWSDKSVFRPEKNDDRDFLRTLVFGAGQHKVGLHCFSGHHGVSLLFITTPPSILSPSDEHAVRGDRARRHAVTSRGACLRCWSTQGASPLFFWPTQGGSPLFFWSPRCVSSFYHNATIYELFTAVKADSGHLMSMLLQEPGLVVGHALARRGLIADVQRKCVLNRDFMSPETEMYTLFFVSFKVPAGSRGSS